MGTLRGHSRPVNIEFLDNVLDHTYVTCGAGHCWPCWGDCQDGSLLRTGTGSTARADAISEPTSQAGIIYGVTGLCMQTANRILWPAGVTVSDAMGYGITELFYGTYGSSAADWIAHRDASNGVSGEIPECAGTEAPEENPSRGTAAALLSFILGLYERFAGSEERSDEPLPNLELLGAVLAARVREDLGRDFSNDRIQRLQGIQREYVGNKVSLDHRLIARDMSGREFAERANGVINDGMRHFADVLGHDAYVALFKLRPGAEITVIRPDLCGIVYDREPGEESR